MMMPVPVLAKGKDKGLPPYILQAHTVAVIVAPGTEIDFDDPRATRRPRKMLRRRPKWGKVVTRGQHRGRGSYHRCSEGPCDRRIRRSVIRGRANRAGPIRRATRMGGAAAEWQADDGSSGRNGTVAAEPVPQPQMLQGQGRLAIRMIPSRCLMAGGPSDGRSAGVEIPGQDGLHSHNVPAVEASKSVIAADKAAAEAAVKTP